jgi:hypothetical protein
VSIINISGSITVASNGYAFGLIDYRAPTDRIMDEQSVEALTKLGLALLIGTIIGAEREYKNKSAGLRTLVLICLGSTLFTMLSTELGADNETGRIASNIVTGIGFLGAGAIMRPRRSVLREHPASCLIRCCAGNRESSVQPG